jgi:predicted RNA-binding Zn ribbon-like protein
VRPQNPLVGEPLALDLVNTRTASSDLLAELNHLRSWLDLQAERLPDPGPADIADLTDIDLQAVRDVREHTATALAHLRAGRPPPGRSIEVLNDVQRAAPAIRELAVDGVSLTAAPARIGSPGRRLAGWLAEASVELLSGPKVGHIRQCEADDCVMLFVATHPSRRWCAPDRCGNRARVARHYRRRKAGDSRA